VASGNLQADFQANVTAEMQGTLQATRLYSMTDDPGVRHMLRFTIARDTMHQNLWLSALEELRADGLEGLPVPAAHPFEERDLDHAYQFWNVSEHTDSALGRWASGPTPDGRGEYEYVADGRPLAEEGPPPGADPLLYVTAPAGLDQANSERPQ
jgi:Mn-containing catalase